MDTTWGTIPSKVIGKRSNHYLFLKITVKNEWGYQKSKIYFLEERSYTVD